MSFLFKSLSMFCMPLSIFQFLSLPPMPLHGFLSIPIYTEELKASYALTHIPSISLILTRMGSRLTGLSVPLLGWTII